MRRWGEPKPAPLAPGERVLWQAAPQWQEVACRVFHVRAVAIYFAALTLIDMLIVRRYEGGGWKLVQAAVPTAVSGLAAVAVLLGLGWATGRTTRYLLTERRIVLQFGIAFPATLSVPLAAIADASLRPRGGGGDIALRLRDCAMLTWPKLWPHVRPWHFLRPQPMLRDIASAASLAEILRGRLLETRARALSSLPRADAA